MNFSRGFINGKDLFSFYNYTQYCKAFMIINSINWPLAANKNMHICVVFSERSFFTL